MKTGFNKEKLLKRIYIVIPAYNEEKSIGNVIASLKKEGYKNIIVVNDGSKDKTSKIAKSKGVLVLDHIINRGLGGALNTGISAALKLGAEIIVTFDADGQHDVSDIESVVKPIIDGKADFVIGSRFLRKQKLNFHLMIRRFGIKILNLITYALFNIHTTDSQSGLRALSRKAASKIRITANRMEVSSEFFREIKKNKLRLKEVPIKTIYTDYSIRKGQSTLNGFRIIMRLILRNMFQ